MRFVGVGEKDDELFAAVAGDEVVDAGCLAEKLSELPEGCVAGVMAEAVVVLLEVVDVQEHDRERAQGAACRGEFTDEAIVKGTTVGQASEGVGGGKLAEFGIGQFQLDLIALDLGLLLAFFGHIDGDAAEEGRAIFGGAGELIRAPGDL